MDLLQPGQIRVHLQGGTSYVCPEANKTRVTQSLGDSIAKIEHFKPAVAPTPLKVAKPETPKAPEGKTKASLLGGLLKDNKIKAGELIEWIEKCTDLGDLGIVMKDEGRATVKAAYKNRIDELT